MLVYVQTFAQQLRQLFSEGNANKISDDMQAVTQIVAVFNLVKIKCISSAYIQLNLPCVLMIKHVTEQKY